MNNDQKMHFWIPDKEVESIEKKPRGGRDKRIVPFREHGSKTKTQFLITAPSGWLVKSLDVSN